MQVIILCAGMGTRLAPYTDNIPKCLVEVNGRPLLDYTIENFKSRGFDKILLVAGYKKELIYEKYCSDKNIEIIENNDFNISNNMFSLYLAKNHLDNESFYTLNGDVIFDGNILDILLKYNDDNNIIAVDYGIFNEESMKVKFDAGRLIDISKDLDKTNSIGVSIDLYRFNKQTGDNLFKIIEKYIKNNELNKWVEVAVKDLMASSIILPVNISGNLWVEVDNINDLKQACSLFGQGK